MESQSDSNDQLESIGRVVALLRRDFPDVSHSSLRFLEREGLISSHRTPGGHRLYSRDTVRRIRRIKEWQSEGLVLSEILIRLQTLDHLPDLQIVADQFLAEILAGNSIGAVDLLHRVVDAGLPLLDALDYVIRPALYTVGQMWERGELIVPREKEVSELARDLIAELSMRMVNPQPVGPPIIAGCLEGEHHQLGMRMLCAGLGSMGYLVHYLGANITESFLTESVEAYSPRGVVLSVTVADHIDRLPAIVRSVNGPDRSPIPIIIGGQAAAEARTIAPALDNLYILEGSMSSSLGALTGILGS